MSIQIKGINHIVLLISNVNRSINFYYNALGCSIDRERPASSLCHSRAGAAFIDLVDIQRNLGNQSFGSRKAEDRNVDHFTLSIKPFIEQDISSPPAAYGVNVGEVVQRYSTNGVSSSICKRS